MAQMCWKKVFLRFCVCFPIHTAIAVDECTGGPAQRLPLPSFWAEAGRYLGMRAWKLLLFLLDISIEWLVLLQHH